MTSYSYDDAKVVLSNYKDSFRTKAASIIENKRTLAILEAELNTAIGNGDSISVINTKAASIASLQTTINSDITYLKTLNTAKTNAQNTVNVTNNISTSGDTINPFDLAPVESKLQEPEAGMDGEITGMVEAELSG